ncbi:MAG: fluoride efflux transporter CrcB [Bacteroidota bacterium]
MKQILYVGIGSFAGGVLRYLASQQFNQKINAAFPWATLSINLVGCLLIGVVYGCFEKELLNSDWKLFLATGMCGGFTTFSAFSYESFELVKHGNVTAMLMYVISSICFGLLLTYFGYLITKSSF